MPEPPMGSSRSETSSDVTTSIRSGAKPAPSSAVTTPSVMSRAMAAATLWTGYGLPPGPGAGGVRSWGLLSICASDLRSRDGDHAGDDQGSGYRYGWHSTGIVPGHKQSGWVEPDA